jgi:hypothetical protein
MATHVDLSWADEDDLWLNDGIFLTDETYKLMYECQGQVVVPPLSVPSATVKTSFPSHQLNLDDDRDFTSTLKCTSKV